MTTSTATTLKLNFSGDESEEAKKAARRKKTAATKKKNRAAKKNAAWAMWAQKARSFGSDLKIIAVDPAHNCGLGFLENKSGIMRTETMVDADPHRALAVLRREVTPTTMAILEDQFIGKVGDVMKIIERRVIFQTILRLLGVQCILVLPSPWQSEMLGKPPKRPGDVPAKGYRTTWLKERSLQVAAFWEPPNDDEADAGNIARWANKKIGMPPIKGEQDR